MKLRNIIGLFSSACLLLFSLTGCKKEYPNIFNGGLFKVQVTLNKKVPYAVDENGEITIGTRDSVLVDYTIESPAEDMYGINVYWAGEETPLQKILITDDTKRKSYSGQFKFYAGKQITGSSNYLGVGVHSFRIGAVNKDGIYVGDGYKTIRINVTSDMKYFALERIYAPDTTGKINPCYFSAKTGQLYSYTTGAANAADIDFGFYSKIVIVSGKPEMQFFMYSLTANPLPFTPYDISSWANKRATLFSEAVAGNATQFTGSGLYSTGANIEDAAKASAKPLTLTNATVALSANTSGNKFVYFKTPEGKFGLLYIHSATYDFLAKSWYMVVSAKVQE